MTPLTTQLMIQLVWQGIILVMNTSVAITPHFLLPQLSWKGSSPSSMAVASWVHPPKCTRTSAPWNQYTRSIISVAPRCKHNEHISSAFVSHRQGQPFARYSYNSRNRGNCFSTTPTLSRDHHFDTLKFVQRLKDEGFSEEQSKAMMLVLSDVIEESIQNLTRTMVLREGLQFTCLEHLPILH